MAEPLHIDWDGKSGKEYRYWIYKIGTEFKARPGNYIFAKEAKPHHWDKPIYIGETGDLSERFESHHKMPCILKNGATHIHVHENNQGEDTRKAEESDLIDKWSPVCNN